MIAATALSRQLPVYTRNPDDFDKIDGLTVVSIAVPPCLAAERHALDQVHRHTPYPGRPAKLTGEPEPEGLAQQVISLARASSHGYLMLMRRRAGI